MKEFSVHAVNPVMGIKAKDVHETQRHSEAIASIVTAAQLFNSDTHLTTIVFIHQELLFLSLN